MEVAGGAADGLDERAGGTQKAFFVGVENGDERNLGQIEAFAQQVDADQHIVFAFAQIAQQAHALQRLNFRMHIAAAHADFCVIAGQIFCHAFGQRGDQDALAFLGALADFGEQVINLTAYRSNFNLRIDKAGRSNNLLHNNAPGLRQLIRAGRCRDIRDLVGAAFKFFKSQRAIVHGRRKPVAIFDQALLAGAIAMPHAVELGNSYVRLIDEKQMILRKIIEQGRRRLAGQATGKMSRIIFDAMAVAHGLDHLQIEPGALMNTLRLHHAALILNFFFPDAQLFKDAADGGLLRSGCTT